MPAVESPELIARVDPVVLDADLRYIRSMIVSLIGAASDNGVIAKNNWMPWNLPKDLAHFRGITRGKTVIMGRKTFDSMQRPMPNRHNIIVSREEGLKREGADAVTTIEEALKRAEQDGMDETFVIGGGEIYRLALPLADRIWLTRVHTKIDDGEAFFPEFDESEWIVAQQERHEADAEHAIPFTIMRYDRKN